MTLEIEWERLLAFTITAAALVASPGPDSMLILRNTLAYGRRAGWRTLAGVQVGVATHAILAVAGISAVLRASESAFRILALCGGMYLAWLGLNAIRGPTPPPPPTLSTSGLIRNPNQNPNQKTNPQAENAFRQGLLCNLLNPKVLVIFIALIPGFVNPESSATGLQIFLLAGILLGLNIPFQSLLVVLAARAGEWLSRPTVAKRTQWVLGGILILFGVGIIADHAVSG